MDISEFDLGFVVGLLEGEGTISIYHQNGDWIPGIKIVMTDLEPMEKLASLFNRRLYVYNKKGGYKPIYTFHVFGLQSLIEFLELISPRLISKKVLAEMLLAYCKSRKAQPYTFKIIESNKGRKVPVRAPITSEEKDLIFGIRNINASRRINYKHFIKREDI